MSSNSLILHMRKTKIGTLESLCSARSHFLTAATTAISIYWVPCTALAFSYQLAHLWDLRELGIKSRLHGGKNWGSEKWQNWFTNPDLSVTQEPVPFPLCLAAYRNQTRTIFLHVRSILEPWADTREWWGGDHTTVRPLNAIMLKREIAWGLLPLLAWTCSPSRRLGMGHYAIVTSSALVPGHGCSHGNGEEEWTKGVRQWLNHQLDLHLIAS